MRAVPVEDHDQEKCDMQLVSSRASLGDIWIDENGLLAAATTRPPKKEVTV